MYKTTFCKSTIIFIFGTLSAFSFAQTEESVAFGPVDVIPTLGIQAAYDDNINSEETGAKSDTIITINPSVRAQVDNGVSGYAFDYSLTKGEYLSESGENFLDQLYGLSFGWNPFDAHLVTLSAELLDSHSRRSPDSPSALLREDIDRFEDTTYAFEYSYGDESIFFGFDLSASVVDRRYKTNREPLIDVDDVDGDGNTTEVRVAGTALNDRETESYNAQFNINPNETLQFNILYGQTKARYDEEESRTLNSDQESYGLGLSWNVSESFDVDVAYFDVNIDQDGENTQTDSYDLSGTWSPLSYSAFTLGVSQAFTDPSATSTDGEDFVEVQTVTAQWQHDWTEALSSNVTFTQSESDYIDSTTNRFDESETATMGLDYQLRRWVLLNFNVSQTSRDGTETSPKSDRTIAQIGAEFTL